MTVIATDGTAIRWQEEGQGRPLLLVHGGVTDASAWNLVRPLLPRGVRVAAMDRRGRGRSDRAEDAPHSLDVEADDVLAVAEALGGGVILVGHSIGATIALQTLRRARRHVAGAVLYEPPLPGTPSGLQSSDAMLEALDGGRHEDALVIFLRDLVKLAPGDIDAFRASPAWASRIGLIWTMRREFDSLAALEPEMGRYASIDVPVELLVGDRTAAHHVEAVDALAAVIPSAHTTELSGQGHGALLQAPGLVADAISAMVSRVGEGAAES